jgi:hypothetical protein
MEDGMVVLALLLIAYCGFRLVSLFFRSRARVEPGTAVAIRPIDRSACQFCEKPLAWHVRLLGILHCSRDCREAERFKLGRAVDGVSGGPLYL